MIQRIAEFCIRRRGLVVTWMSLLTAGLSYFALTIEVRTVFEDMLPSRHEYVKTHQKFKETFGGSNMVTIMVEVKDGDIFPSADNSYDAYDKDIALLHIYFKRSTVFQLGTQPTMTWIDFLSQVGGLLGLCIGISIITFIELVWLCLRLAAQKLMLTRLII